MKKLGRSCGYLALIFATFIAALIIQLVAGIACMIPFAIKAGFEMAQQGTVDPELLQQSLLSFTNDIVGISILVAHILTLISFGIWFYYLLGRPHFKIETSNFKGKNLVAILCLAEGICILTNSLMPFAYELFPQTLDSYSALMESAGFGTNTLTLIAAVLVAPIGEELVYRGVVLHYGKKMFNWCKHKKLVFWLANILQAFLFGFYHMNIVQGTYAFFIGLLLGYAYEKFGSILVVMLIHALINAQSLYVGLGQIHI